MDVNFESRSIVGTDKEGNEITLIVILGTEANGDIDKVQLQIEKVKYIVSCIFWTQGSRSLR